MCVTAHSVLTITDLCDLSIVVLSIPISGICTNIVDYSIDKAAQSSKIRSAAAMLLNATDPAKGQYPLGDSQPRRSYFGLIASWYETLECTGLI